MMNKKIKLGLSGVGDFAERCFIELFRSHPMVESLAIADIDSERLARIGEKFGIDACYDSHATMCGSDVDAIAIFTQRHLHGPMAIEALKKGKHVYCAVPAASSVAEVEDLVKTVNETGLIYMMGETSYYYPSALYCREQFKKGKFGDFVYGEGEYLHDMSHGFYEAYQHAGGPNWQRVAGIPPMYYPTHSTSMLISTTGQRLTKVSCLGYRDKVDDKVFGEGLNNWDNPFSNETALFRTSGGGMFRVNEFRRVGDKTGNSVRMSMTGTEGTYQEQGQHTCLWTSLAGDSIDLTEELRCGERKFSIPTDKSVRGVQSDFFTGVSKYHPVHRLPKEFHGLPNGHYGSHHFLVDDFCRSVIENKLAPNHVWAAARYTVPGLVAHESALREGAMLDIPDFGDPGAEWEYLFGD